MLMSCLLLFVLRDQTSQWPKRMEQYGDISGQFYRNVIQWLVADITTNDNTTINTNITTATTISHKKRLQDVKIVTYSQSIYNWLISSSSSSSSQEGFTNVIRLRSEGELIDALEDGVDIFIGSLGISESQTNINALKEFCSNGGGLFVAGYVFGHDYWYSAPFHWTFFLLVVCQFLARHGNQLDWWHLGTDPRFDCDGNLLDYIALLHDQ